VGPHGAIRLRRNSTKGASRTKIPEEKTSWEYHLWEEELSKMETVQLSFKVRRCMGELETKGDPSKKINMRTKDRNF